jgi:UDP-N-acetylglucosamine--dolichyl-phosphate N-acetylglucosaminephosphotransferase
MSTKNRLLAVLPLVPSLYLLSKIDGLFVANQVWTSCFVGLCGYVGCRMLIPVVAEYTLKKGLSGKDLGKKGTINESVDVPEALGLVVGTVFLVCAIFSQLVFVSNRDYTKMMTYNSALFSVCFMIFLGFVDDTLDLKWRYKLILPPIASIPLLSAYSGNTALYVPTMFRSLLMAGPRTHTPLGAFINMFFIVDRRAGGAIIELAWAFLLFMGLLAVFCTNAINIYAGKLSVPVCFSRIELTFDIVIQVLMD